MESGVLDYYLGYGLVQWTFNRHEGLFKYCLEDLHCSVADEDAQISFLVSEITGSGPASGYATKQFLSTQRKNVINGQIETWNESRWKDTDDIEEATMAFCYSWVRPRFDCDQQRFDSAKYYLELYGNGELERPEPSQNTDPNIVPNVDPDAPVSERMQALLDLAIQLKDSDNVRYPHAKRPDYDRNDSSTWWPYYVDKNGNLITGYEYPYFDCGGFVYYLYHTIFPETVGMTASPGMMVSNLNYACLGTVQEVGIENLRPGDIIHQTKSGDGYHVMLYFGEVDGVKKYIHSSSFDQRISFNDASRLLTANGTIRIFRPWS